MIEKKPFLGEKIHTSFPYVKAEILWAVQEEMCMTIEDFLARRSRMLFLDAKASMESAPDVAKIMAVALHRDDLWIKQQIDEFAIVAKNYLPILNSNHT
jgi:glycerol-3-phosphate dehydrogenase